MKNICLFFPVLKSPVLFVLFLFFCVPHAFSQKGKYKSFAFEVYGGYSKVNFLNAVYSQNVNKEIIKKAAPNFEVGMRAVTRFVVFNASYLKSSFKVLNGNSLFVDRDTEFKGFEGGASLFLAPLLSEYFSPYIGIGYFGGSINVSELVTKGSGSSKTTSTNVLATSTVQTPLWKFGAMLAYKRFALSAEYKQSFGIPEKNFQQISVTMAFRMIKN